MPKDSPGNTHPLDYMFHPQSIAVVGISADLPKFWMRQLYFDALVRSGYPGRLYLVNPKGGELEGYPIYRMLTDVPGPVDHVVASIPAKFTPGLMEECRTKGVKVVHVFASGFAETGETDRIALQDQLVEIARRGNIRIIGPNCLGIYYPKGKIGLSPDFPREAGAMGFLCQSGGNTDFMVRLAAARGLRFSKVVSYGNACDINECDLIDYFAADPETEVIAAYIEGVSDGRRFAQVVKKAASLKPVVIYKGGYTEGGLRAAASHTGSLAGTDAVWDGVVRQAGAIRVHSIEEMVDMLVALLRMKPPEGPNACVVGTGGGASVMATDEVERAGLRLPPMPPEIRERLKEFIDLANSMLRNPIDAGPVSSHDGFEFLVGAGNMRPMEALRKQADREVGAYWRRFHDVLQDWRDLDLLVFHHGFDISPVPVDEYAVVGAAGLMVLASRQFDLPKAIVLHSIANDSTWQVSAELRALCVDLGLPLFLSMRGAATAIKRLLDFHRAHPDWRPSQGAIAGASTKGRARPGEAVKLDTAALLGIPAPVSQEAPQTEIPDDGLKEREERFRVMIENSLDGVCILSSDMTILYESPSVEKIIGYRPDEMVGRNIADFVHPEDMHNTVRTFGKLARHPAPPVAATVRIKHKDGTWHAIEGNVHNLLGNPAVRGILANYHDVTDRLRDQEALRERERHFRVLIENSLDDVAVLDANANVIYESPSSVRVLGYRPEDYRRKNFLRFLHPEDAARVSEEFAQLMRNPGGTYQNEVRARHRDGSWRTIEIMARNLLDDPVVGGIIINVRDITERKTAERERVDHAAALARAEELERSRQRIVAAQEFVRQDIAHQLHGSVQNRLIIVLHRLAEIERSMEQREQAQELADLRQKLADLLDNQVRPISHRLYPSILRRGLIPALQSLCDHFERSLSIDLELEEVLVRNERANPNLIPEQVRLAAYRIAEEALTNIVKHTKASVVTIDLRRAPDEWLTLRLRDNGQGFDLAPASAGRGLMMMQDYAAVAGGNCSIESAPDEGTEVTAQLPLSAPDAAHPEKA
ncbi:MAG: PAS domain S-box protein [Dehalococcoidia bacterium]|nr:PAS domain S-box protein [Dehalococcoidia bacterium]